MRSVNRQVHYQISRTKRYILVQSAANMRKNKYNYVLTRKIEEVAKLLHLPILLCSIKKKEKDNDIYAKHAYLAGL